MREEQFRAEISSRTDEFRLIHSALETNYRMWVNSLKDCRYESPLLQLYSNRQVMMLIILLTQSNADNTVKHRFLGKFSLSRDVGNHQEKEHQLTIQCLIHYLRCIRIDGCNLSNEHVSSLYEKHAIDYRSPAGNMLDQLCEFLGDLFQSSDALSQTHPTTNEKQQYLVTLNMKEKTLDGSSSFDHDLDMETCCILLNLLHHRLPASFQILWCSGATEDDIRLFFMRVRTFRHFTYAVLEIDKMHHRLREILLNEQDALTRQSDAHGPIYYVSRELTSRNGLRPYHVTAADRNAGQTLTRLRDLFRRKNFVPPEIQIICGAPGIGKSKLTDHCPIPHTHSISYRKDASHQHHVQDTRYVVYQHQRQGESLVTDQFISPIRLHDERDQTVGVLQHLHPCTVRRTQSYSFLAVRLQRSDRFEQWSNVLLAEQQTLEVHHRNSSHRQIPKIDRRELHSNSASAQPRLAYESRRSDRLKLQITHRRRRRARRSISQSLQR